MWIRSQDRLSLGDYKEVYIIDSSIMGVSGAADDTKLGDYETPEMALEVLGGIEKRLVNHMRMREDFLFLLEMPTLEEVRNKDKEENSNE